MTNTMRNLAYALLVALVGATFVACGGSSGGVDAGKDAHGDAADAPATDAATEHGDAAQPNDAQTSDVASNGDAGANDADASGDGSSDATGDVSTDISHDASSDTSSDASSDAGADVSSDAAADTGADVSSDTSSDTTGDAGADSAADTAGGADDAASDAADDVANCESTDTPTSCGTCGLVCPGYQQPNDNVTCSGSTTCTFSCQGENYDVNGQATDGCEATDSPMGNHTQASAANVGAFTCADGSSNPSITAKLISDARAHANPALAGFDATTGSAPDWFAIAANGGATCVNDVQLTLQVSGSSNPTCYKLTVITDKTTLTATTNAAGTASVAQGNGAYSNSTTIYLSVSKTCSTAITENVTYTLNGHL